MDDQHYRSTERFTATTIDQMGTKMNEVRNSSGLVVAVLNDEDFSKQYETSLD